MKYKVIASNDLTLDYHTWTKGLDYEVVEKGDYFTIASNESSCNFYMTDKESVLSMFDREENNNEN